MDGFITFGSVGETLLIIGLIVVIAIILSKVLPPPALDKDIKFEFKEELEE